jgi:hypothetical protein
MQKSRKIQDSLYRIRDVVLAQTAAIEEQMKDSNRNVSNGYAPDLGGYSDESKGSGGFAGPDTKKRRGVSARSGPSKDVLSKQADDRIACGASWSVPQLQSSRNSRMASWT